MPAEIYAAADRFPKKVTIERKTVDRGTRLAARLAPGGAYAVRLRPAR